MQNQYSWVMQAMLRYPPSWMEELRSRADIVQVIGSYSNLKKKGKEYVGLCPFHNEKSGSFYVSEQKQTYHCFGCGASGSVITFVMEMEHLGFQEAVAYLAERVGMTLPELRDDPDYEKNKNLRERLCLLNKEAARRYHAMLWQPEGAPVLEYFRKRGLSDEIIRRFGLGASARNVSIQGYLSDLGFTREEMLEAGITKTGENGSVYDMFRGRALFPIIDRYGNVLGFGGRALGDEKPKYLNTADTPVYSKQKHVFAENLLKKCRKPERVLLVEGYMDVVSLTQFGIEAVVASLGTSLTSDQARLVKRFAPQVFLAYDGDGPGQKAIERGLDIMEAEDIPVRVLVFPDHLDPDELIRQRGVEAFRRLHSLSTAEYRMLREKEKHDLSVPGEKMAYAIACASFLKKVKEPVELDSYLQQLSADTGFDRNVLREQLGRPPIGDKNGYSAAPAIRRTYPSAAVKKTGRTLQTILAFVAGGYLSGDALKPEDLEDELEREFLKALQQGESAVSFLERQSDENSRNRIGEIMNSITAEDGDTSVLMAQQALLAFRKEKMESRISKADGLSLEEAATIAEQYTKLNEIGKPV